ncbi:MAG: cellulase family glycosylhydrolase [Bacteroidota bacterium]|nr:cellulase family glycosylhydrolase [Bacteroidota bacterium]
MIRFILAILIGIPVFVSAQISPKEAISQMTKGINLGNTLEPPYEGDWGNPTTQEYMFDMYKKEGFDCVRIPVRWDKHMATTSPYKINETWFNRVEQILDWGLARGLYIVVNSHHDDWIKNGYTSAINRARFDSLWSQVAVRFKGKSEKLIFEVLNEPHGLTKAQNDDMHQRIISIIRKTNPTRLIIFQGHNWGGSDELLTAAIPNDPYLIGSFHSYDPYLFGLEGQGTWGTTSDINALKSKFQKVKDWSVKNDIPVFLGEFGSLRKCDFNSRMKHYKTYVEFSHSFGFASCAWDDGGDFRIMYRSAKTWDDDIKDILTHSSEQSPRLPRLSLVQDTIIKLDWYNHEIGYDSISIERRTSTGTYLRIGTLNGQSISFTEHQLTRNREYIYRVIAWYNNGTSLYSYPQKILLPTYVPIPPPVRKSYTGQPLAIPGKIEAEHFDEGGEGFSYHDSDSKNTSGGLRPNEPIDIYDLGSGKYYVIDNAPGEWLEYTVNVAQKGSYDITATTAAFEGGGTFRLKIGSAESEIIKAPTTFSWVNTKTVNFSMNLEAGEQIMRLTFLDKPMFYIDFLEFKRIVPVGNSAELNDPGFGIFQNHEDLIISSHSSKQIEIINLYNILGTLVKTIESPGTSFRLSTLDLRDGVYVVQLISGKEKFSKKIVIQ